MASTLLASGTSAANSADVVIASGARKSFKLVCASNGYAAIQYKLQSGAYQSYITLNSVNKLAQVDGPLTVRVSRPAQANAVSVDEE